MRYAGSFRHKNERELVCVSMEKVGISLNYGEKTQDRPGKKQK